MTYLDQYADAYIRAMDRGDMESIAAILSEACDDPSLSDLLLEIDSELLRETGEGECT